MTLNLVTCERQDSVCFVLVCCAWQKLALLCSMAKRSCSIVEMHSFLDYLVELRKQRNLALEYDSFWWDVDEAHVHETMIPGNVLLAAPQNRFPIQEADLKNIVIERLVKKRRYNEAFECAIGLSFFSFSYSSIL